MRDPSFPDLVKYYSDKTAHNANTPSEPIINRQTRRHEKALLRKVEKRRG
jgi:hypothetical protein